MLRNLIISHISHISHMLMNLKHKFGELCLEDHLTWRIYEAIYDILCGTFNEQLKLKNAE